VGRGLSLPDASGRVLALVARWAESKEQAAGQEGV
jgi:hypothetical protein